MRKIAKVEGRIYNSCSSESLHKLCLMPSKLFKSSILCQVWWGKPLIPALGGGRGRWISEFKASLVYKVSSRTAMATQRNPVSKNKNKTRVASCILLTGNKWKEMETSMESSETCIHWDKLRSLIKQHCT